MNIYLSIFNLILLIKCKESKGGSSGIAIEIQDPRSFPFLVQLRCPLFRKPGKASRCGGSLIHPKWVLTAGNCFPNDRQEIEWLLHQTTPMVFMGSIRMFDYLYGMTNFILNIFQHPYYLKINNSEIYHNVALVELKFLYNISVNIQIIRLSNFYVNCTHGILVGMSLTNIKANDSFSTNIKYFNLNIKKYFDLNEHPETVFYTEDKTGGDIPGSYGGALGSPFICTLNSTLIQIGVLSWSEKTKTAIRTAYERVDLIFEFVLEHVPQIMPKLKRRWLRNGRNATKPLYNVIIIGLVGCFCNINKIVFV